MPGHTAPQIPTPASQTSLMFKLDADVATGLSATGPDPAPARPVSRFSCFCQSLTQNQG